MVVRYSIILCVTMGSYSLSRTLCILTFVPCHHEHFNRLQALCDVSRRPDVYRCDPYELATYCWGALSFSRLLCSVGETESHGEHRPSSYKLWRRKPTADTDPPSRKILDINEIYAVFVACGFLMSASMMDDT
ncbi:hypothetical protein V8E53_010970 [Lactarius tabidus]